MCELKSVMRIHSWATTETVSKFLAQAFGINKADAEHRGTVLNVSHSVFYKVVAVGFNPLFLRRKKRRGINTEINFWEIIIIIE